ncbi:MAG: hypothetical protein JXP34_04950 [Planctomycetes bacterium]|nr:hypothetical protein [Planctomycetota bacterium]
MTQEELVATVRYGALKFRELFEVKDPSLRRGEDVVVQTPRGVEVGTLSSAPRPRSGADPSKLRGAVIRRMSSDDRRRAEENERRAREKLFLYVQQKVNELELSMKLVAVESLFGENKVVVHYTAESRVDFRELVHLLARRFRARIEMRQIGPRDCTRICGGIGPCGRTLCCETHLVRLEPVTIRMAKDQGQPLNPGKNCGACGKLKCCLRYELDLDRIEQLRKGRRKGASAPAAPARPAPPDDGEEEEAAGEEAETRRGRQDGDGAPSSTGGPED